MDEIFQLEVHEVAVHDDESIMRAVQFVIAASVPIASGLRASQLICPVDDGDALDPSVILRLRETIEAALSLFDGVRLLVDRVQHLANVRRPPKVCSLSVTEAPTDLLFSQILRGELWNLRLDQFHDYVQELLRMQQTFCHELALVQLVTGDPSCDARFVPSGSGGVRDMLIVTKTDDSDYVKSFIVPPCYTNERDDEAEFNLTALCASVVKVLSVIPKKPFRRALKENSVLYLDPAWKDFAKNEVLPLMKD